MGENNKELPIKVSYAITKNLRMMEPEIKLYDEERTKLLEKHGDKAENNTYKIPKEHMEAWEKDIADLLDVDVTVTVHQVDISNFTDGIEPVVMEALEFMIKEEKQEESK